jgi:hypothetical protein
VKLPVLPKYPVAAAYAFVISAILLLSTDIQPLFAQTTGSVLISEFMASNGHTLLDEDGDSSDWIELFNSGTNTVDLGGWHLTDNAADLTEWTFPETNLPPAGFLIVFASGKNRAVAGQELHTSFSLSSSGEYLALVRPDGSVAQEFAPQFPPQLEDVSYGYAFNYATNLFVAAGTPAKWEVPHSTADFPANWQTTNFNDSAWPAGPTGLGYSTLLTNIFGGGPATNVAPGKVAAQSSTYNNDTNDFGPEKAVDGNYSDFSHTFPTNIYATWQVNLATNYGINRIVIRNRPGFLSRLRDITVWILSLDGKTTNYTSPLLNPENVLGGGVLGQGPTNLVVDLSQQPGGLVVGGQVRVTRTPDPDLSGTGGQGNNSESNVLCMVETEVWGVPMLGVSNVFNGLVQTDLRTAMSNVNATVLMRQSFDLPLETVLPNFLTLQMKYNAGFVAYLDGVEVARRNAPVALAWNSAATNGQSDSAAVVYENIDISPFIGLLQPGQNVLAIQGLNVSAANSEFLILPQLMGTSLTLTPDQYFSTPTPGAPNSGGALGVTADPQFSVPRGFYSSPISLVITSATVGAQIHFTTDGSLPTAVTGTLYTGPINITNTTVLRAVATKPGYLPSEVPTETYIFSAGVITQSLQSATNAGWPAVWTGTTPDYDMDPRITGPYAPQMAASLQSLPSVFLTTTMSNLFDPATGIYVNPTQHGSAWEREASMEMVDTNGQTEFELACGLRIQGGAFRSFSYTQKKSFRVLFTSDYGPSKLDYNVFPNQNAVQEFNTLVLRAGGNDGYAWAAASNTVQFTRDEFGRRLFQDMGHVNTHGTFVHLYLNGLYWGLYNLTERPNEDFSSSYLGDDPDAWDSISGSAMNTTPLKNGDWQAWTTLSNMVGQVATYADYEKVQGNNPDGSRNQAWPVYYDKLDYMDYMIVNIWGGNWDWPANNFWLGYDRSNNNLGVQFYMWDYEDTIGMARSPIDYVAPKASTWVAYPYSAMMNFPEFKIDFADRVQKYFFNGGLLTPAVLTNRYAQLAGSIQEAIIAETARWGDDNIEPPLTLTDWENERDWILNTYLQQRTAIVMQQLLTNGLYPGVGAPAFSQYGGAVPAGYNLILTQTNAGGVIYYTTDGSDPRTPGAGTVSGTAQAYYTPLVMNAPTLVRARVLGGGQWSALVEATLEPPQDLNALELTEIMYDPPNIGSTNGDSYEFLEMKNTGATTLDLSGLAFTAGITFTFTNGTFLAPGGFYVIGRDANALRAKYPGLTVNGIYTGKLDNSGETITLSQTNGATVFSVPYGIQAPWPVTPGGFGYSLVQKNPGVSQAPNDGSMWRASTQLGGSPGADDPAPNIPGVVVNEVLANSPAPLSDTVELYNPTPYDVDISGWYLTDDPGTPQKYRIPNGTILSDGGFATFNESQFNPTPGVGNSFAFSSAGESAYLFSANTNGQLTGYDHGFQFGASYPGVSFGRYVNSAGDEQFPSQTGRSFGQANLGPRVGPVVINEIQYHPPPGGDEFVELLNIAGTNVPLYDPAHPTNTWNVHGAAYYLPTNITLGPAQMLLVVATNPAAFRAKYGVPSAVQIVGPYPGVLQNSGEDLELEAPDTPASNTVPYVVIDAVNYDDKAPWPAGADGSGPSLQRVVANAYGNDPSNWMADIQTPGGFNPNTDSDGDGIPDWWEVANGTDWLHNDANADPDGDGYSNLQEYWAGTDPHDSNSFLKISGIVGSGNAVSLQFIAASNHTYSVLYKESLGDALWTKLADVPGQSVTQSMTVNDPTPMTSSRFYRLVTPAQP